MQHRTNSDLIDDIFDKLDNWKNLPHYQLERRADIFFSIYLADILKHNIQTEIDFIIPEFPIHKDLISEKTNFKNIKGSNMSIKLDYLATDLKSRKIFLIELKTNTNSRNSKQDSYLKTILGTPLNDLINGIIKLRNHSANKTKYKYNKLLDLLLNNKIINERNEILDNDFNFSLIFIQPNSTLHDFGKIITFKNVIESIEYRSDPLTSRFIKSLEKWGAINCN